MKTFIFQVEAAGALRPVELTFATEPEVQRFRTWRKKSHATDAGEFAALAAKRWFYYKRQDATVASFDELRVAIKSNQRSEIAFLMVASAQWLKRYKFLALALCRRTWCHHLALDFLAVRPDALFQNQPIYGLGTGILFSLTMLAESLHIETIWGEATANSAPFYEKVLQIRPLEDLFIIKHETMFSLREYYRKKPNNIVAPITSLK